MPHVSRKKLPTKVLKQILDALLYIFTNTRDKEETAQFLDALLSDTEKVMLAKRLAIVYLLSEGLEGESIAEALNVTPSTVSRIKLWYETKGSGYKIAIKKLKKRKLLIELKILALKFAAYLAKSAGGRI